jgi:hypothetical protein
MRIIYFEEIDNLNLWTAIKAATNKEKNINNFWLGMVIPKDNQVVNKIQK